MPNQPKTPARAVRIDDDLYHRAMAKALKEGTTVSAVIRDALEKYIEEGEHDDPGSDG